MTERRLSITKAQAEAFVSLNAAVTQALANVALYSSAVLQGHGLNPHEYQPVRVENMTATEPYKLVVAQKQTQPPQPASIGR